MPHRRSNSRVAARRLKHRQFLLRALGEPPKHWVTAKSGPYMVRQYVPGVDSGRHRKV